MNILSYISEGTATLFQNKMRSLLSLLGIMIGISSVVILTAIGDGMKETYMKDLVKTQNIIKIARGKVENFNPFEGRREWQQNPSSTEDSSKLINVEGLIARERIFSLETVALLEDVFHDAVKAVVPMMNFNIYGFIYEGKRKSADIKTVSNQYFEAHNIHPARGTLFTPHHIENSQAVVVIGSSLVEIFQKKDPIGKVIYINNTAFTIVWMLEKTEQYEIDGAVFLPYATAKSLFGITTIDTIEVHAKQVEGIHNLKRHLGYFLTKYTGGTDPSSNEFQLQSNELLIREFDKQLSQMTLFVTGIAAISLFVGGIGIMNIMLVSVTERTREIGIRKAIGAKRRDIITQFLTESSLLSFSGGMIAIGLSYAICAGLEYFFQLNTVISPQVIFIATLFSIFMGVLFGLIPAWKAAKMDAIEALRFE